MDVLLGIVLFFFMLLVDWRLNKIYKELRRLNQTITPYASTKSDGAPAKRL
jgi:hypothetical protein